MKTLLTVILLTLLTGCSAVDIKQYSSNNPQLDLFSYFTGHTRGWGIVQDRKGSLTRQFTVDIEGTVSDDGKLTLYEEFIYNDGEESTRTWIISKTADHSYTGTAEDILKPADGLIYGNVLNWQYQMNIEVDDTSWKIKFDDWMFLVSDEVLLNKATMSKFGLKVGEVTIVFQK